MISKVSLIVFGLALVLSAQAHSFGGQSNGGSSFGGQGQEGETSGGHRRGNHQQSENGQEGGETSSRHRHRGGRQGGNGQSRRGHGFDLSKYVKFQNCDSTAPIQIHNFNISMRSISGRLVSSSNISNNLFFNLAVSVDQPAFSAQLIKNLPLSSFPLAQSFVNLSGLDQEFEIPTMALHPMGPAMFHGASSQISEEQIQQIKEQLESMENSTVTTIFSAQDESQNTIACFQLNQDGSLVVKAMKMFYKHHQRHSEGEGSEGNRHQNSEGPEGPEGGDEQGPEEHQESGEAGIQLMD